MATTNAMSYKLILAFVSILIGAVLIGSVATETQSKTTTTTVTDEVVIATTALVNSSTVNESVSLSLANVNSAWKAEDCPITSFTLSNATDDLTVTTDYVFNSTYGTFTLVDTADVRTIIANGLNYTYADYTYCGDDYMNLSWGRTMMDLIPGFFGLAILMIGVGLFYSVVKDQNLI